MEDGMNQNPLRFYCKKQSVGEDRQITLAEWLAFVRLWVGFRCVANSVDGIK